MDTSVWHATRLFGFDEATDDIGIAATPEIARGLCELDAANDPMRARRFLDPPLRPVRLEWRATRFDDDDPDETYDGVEFADSPHYGTYRVAERTVVY